MAPPQEALFSDFEAQQSPPSNKLLKRAESIRSLDDAMAADPVIFAVRLAVANSAEVRKNSDSKLRRAAAGAKYITSITLGAAYFLPTYLPVSGWRNFRFKRQLYKEYPGLFTGDYKSMYSPLPQSKKPAEVYAKELAATT